MCFFSSFSVPYANRDQQPSRFLVELREGGIEDTDWNWTGFVVNRLYTKKIGGRALKREASVWAQARVQTPSS
jgi:hypothetical protein